MTNGAVAGLFDGGNVTVPGAQLGAQFTFQVRGWSSFSGPSYESALLFAQGSGVPLTYAGQSTLGFFTVPNSGSIPIFGTGPGQVGGFELQPVPEPGAWLLGVLGLSLLAAFTRRRH
jgi:hypothetical protein